MAKRFHIPFRSLLQEDWTYEIHDADFVGDSLLVKGRVDGFRLNYEAESTNGRADMFTPVLASSSTFDMLIENSDMETFITDLATSREGRFHAVVYRDSSLYWIGYIVADEVRVSDRYYPYNLSIFSIDGLSRLREVDYRNPATGLKYTGRQTALQHFYNVISILGLNGVVTMPTTHFQTNFNWYASGMGTGSGNNGLTQFDIDHVVFHQTDREGNEIVWSAYDVLEALCRALGGRFFFALGHWWFMQSAEYAADTQPAWQFNISGTQTNYLGTNGYDKNINYTSRYKITGGSYTFLRAIKKVIVDYRHLSSNNRAEGFQWDETGPTGFETLPGVLGVSASFQSKAYIKIPFILFSTYQVLNPAHTYKPHQYVFRIHIKAGTEYLERPANNQTAWTSIVSYVEVRSPFLIESQNQVPTTFFFETTTDYLPTSMDGDQFEVKFELVKVVDQADNTITEGVFLDYVAFFRWDVNAMILSVSDEGLGNAPSLDVQRHEVEDDTDGNTGIYKVETYIGDGPLNYSLSRLTDGTDNTEDWTVGGSGTPAPISTLLAQEVLNLRQQATIVYQGVYFASDFNIYNRATDGTNAFIPIRLAFSAFRDQWEGDFVKVATGSFTTTVTPPYTPGPGNTGGPIKLPPSVPPSIPPGNIPDTTNLFGNIQGSVSATTMSVGVVAAETDPTISINAVPYSFVKQGDTVSLVNPVTGHAETFTVATTPAPNATTLDLVGTTVQDFPLGTYLKISPSAVYDRGFAYLTRDFSGTLWPIPVATGILPQLATVGAAEMLRRIRVWRSGVRLFYNEHTSGDYYPDGFYTTTDRIMLYQKARNETMYLEVIP
jgi:hypothetical protein